MYPTVAVVTWVCLIFQCFAKSTAFGWGGRQLRWANSSVYHPDSDEFIKMIKCISWQCSKASYFFKIKQSSEDVLAFNWTAFYSWLAWWICKLEKNKCLPFFNVKQTRGMCCTKCVVLREMQTQLCSNSWFQYSVVCDLILVFLTRVITWKIKL